VAVRSLCIRLYFWSLSDTYVLRSDVGKVSSAVLPVDKAALADLFAALGGGGWFIRRGWEDRLSVCCSGLLQWVVAVCCCSV